MKKRKLTRFLKVLPVLGLTFVLYQNISATTVKNGNKLNLNSVKSALADTNCETECFDGLLDQQENTWDRARENMLDCVSGPFIDAFINNVLPASGNPTLDIANNVSTIAETFPTIFEAYGCLDFMETQMNLELDQCYDNYTDCAFGCGL